MSFDKDLFRKELKKCFGYLTPNDAEQLRLWVKNNFGELMIV